MLTSSDGPHAAAASTSTVSAVCVAPGCYTNGTGVGTSAASLLPTWSASRGTAYLRGDIVLDASGNCWVCIKSGTAAPSGTPNIVAPALPSPGTTQSALGISGVSVPYVATLDGAEWTYVAWVGNGWLVTNTHATNTLYLALDSTATSSSTAIKAIPAGQALGIPWAVPPSWIQVIGSAAGTTYDVVAQP
ncbi:MAG TPA: hypothetical protein VLT47_11040 [Anaeromyxobacteraceae bacterium]|nr:hypothetical protein [Anaeromyxobacteraceae bacterium]